MVSCGLGCYRIGDYGYDFCGSVAISLEWKRRSRFRDCGRRVWPGLGLGVNVGCFEVV